MEDNTRFAESLDLDFPILSDPDCSVAKAYGVVKGDAKYPARWTFYIGKDGKILDVDRKVSPGTAGADVAAKLGALGVASRPGK